MFFLKMQIFKIICFAEIRFWVVCIESTSKCKMPTKLNVMFEKDFIWCEEI